MPKTAVSPTGPTRFAALARRSAARCRCSCSHRSTGNRDLCRSGLSQPRLPRGHRLCYRARHDVARKTFEEALAITKEDILEALDGLPNGRKYTLTYAIEAVRAIIGDYLLRIKGCNLAQLNEVIRCESMCPNCLLTENCSLRDERVDQELREVGEIE